MEKCRISEIFKIHICRQVLAITNKLYPPCVGGGGVSKTPRKQHFFELSSHFTGKQHVEKKLTSDLDSAPSNFKKHDERV